MKKIKNIPDIVSSNIKLLEDYCNFYPSLKRYFDLKEIKRDYGLKGIKAPSHLWEEEDYLWEDLIKLDIHEIASFGYYLIEKEELAFYKNEVKINVNSFIDNINLYANEKLEEEYYPIIKNEEDLINNIDNLEFISNDEFFSKFVNILINTDYEVKENMFTDYMEKYFFEILVPITKEEADFKIKELEEEKIIIEEIINKLIPICKKAKDRDESWEHNFINNEIVSEVIKRMKN